jgi:uncharacterized protein YqfB (UPF0267 family)
MDTFMPKNHGSKTKRERGVCVIRCTGKHADMIEAGVKTFMLRFDDPTPMSFEAGKFLTIIRYDGRFRNQRTIAKNEVLLKSVVNFHLDKDGMTVGRTNRVLTEKELHELACQDGFTCWDQMATHYLSRRTAYHSAYPWRQRKTFDGIMITWEWRPDLRNEVFETSGRAQKKQRVSRKEWNRRQEEMRMVA